MLCGIRSKNRNFLLPIRSHKLYVLVTSKTWIFYFIKHFKKWVKGYMLWSFLTIIRKKKQILNTILKHVYFEKKLLYTDLISWSRWPRGLRLRFWPLSCWDRGFESRSRHGCLSLCFCVVLSCAGRVFAKRWSLVQKRPNKCLNKITKPAVWGGPGPYKDCRATDDDDDDDDKVLIPQINPPSSSISLKKAKT
jgi:hypothetical protein